MKFILSMVICSSIAGQCMQPYQLPDTFESQYDCLMFGYQESIVKMEKLGKTDVNKYGMFIKFYCTPDNSI